MSCKLKLWQHGVGQAGDGNEEFTESRGVTHNDHATSYSTEGDCSNTSWGVFFHNPPEQGSGIIIGKGDAAGGPFHENHHGEGKGSLNHRFYKINDEISFVKKIELPELPEGAIVEDMDIYGRRADAQGEWGHYPFVDGTDLSNPNHSQQHLTLEIKGSPCPGAAAGIPIGHKT